MRELRTLLEAWRLIAELRSAKPTADLASDLTIAVRALERAYSKASQPAPI
jgi:hypothetical protein